MRIIFVGVHNKPGKLPLDSSTKSGKIIDIIAKGLNKKIEKTNLYNSDYLPTERAEKDYLIEEWFYTTLPTNEDIIILLGCEVQKEFKFELDNIIKLKHPAYRKNIKKDYITNAVNEIKKLTTKNK